MDVVIQSFGQFQFTHPGRGATGAGIAGGANAAVFQFTHPGRGATTLRPLTRTSSSVSIHAPREGCDARRVRRNIFSIAFQFTHPGRGATR